MTSRQQISTMVIKAFLKLHIHFFAISFQYEKIMNFVSTFSSIYIDLYLHRFVGRVVGAAVTTHFINYPERRTVQISV